jgi:TRAP-type C4-dicarboxylate transport system permease small subunit
VSAVGAHLSLEDGDEIAAPFSEAPEFIAERWLRRGVEVLAAAVVLAEVGILLCGIAARAVFNQPIIWSDELASILFLWLAMLGSALAAPTCA